jgi:hypothetical protein
LTDRGDAFACAAVLAAAYACTWPVTNSGVLDDWSFVRTALDLSRTGVLRYNGWGAPMVGAQAVLGAASARIFGPSAEAVRLVMVPLAVLTAVALRALLRRAGASADLASLGALSFGLSPVVFPLAVSFMTDLPAVLAILACALALVRADEVEATGRAVIWIGIVALAGSLGGTVRQTTWLGPLGMLSWTALRRRREPVVALAAAGLTVATAAAFVASESWLGAQPYVARLEPLGDAVGPMIRGLPGSLERLPALLFTATALLLPLLLGLLVAALVGSGPAGMGRLVVTFAPALVLAPVLLWAMGPAPWMSNGMLSHHGLLAPGVLVLGERPATIAPAVGIALTLATYAMLWLVPATLLLRRRARRRAAASMAPKGAVPPIGALLGNFAVPYAVVLALRTFQAGAFDRYLVPLLPWAIVMLVGAWPPAAATRRRGPAQLLAWLLMAVWGTYGVAITHDLFATLRARQSAFDGLAALGVPPTAITAGVEIDGLTEIDARGFVSGPYVLRPPEVRESFRPRTDLPVPFWFLDHTPSIQPRWWITLSSIPGLVDAGVPGPEYVTWLPPGRHRVRVLVPKHGS